MSHIAVYKTTIGTVNIDILKKALEVLVLAETDLKMRDYIEDYYGKHHTVWEGLKIIGALFNDKTLPRGIGVAVDKDGNLAFVGEAFGSPDFNKVKSKIEQTYKLVALVIALQNMGYEIQTNEKMTTIEATLNKNKIGIEIKGKGEITTDLDGFAGKTCFEEAQKLAEILKGLGVNVNAKDLQPKPESQIEPPERQRQRS